MKKKIVFSLLIMMLICITGCGKGMKVDGDKTQYVCMKKGIEQSSSTSSTSWTEDITHTAKLAADNKLTYYSTKYHYYYKNKQDCDHWCDIKVDWNNEINKNNYQGGHRETNCNCAKNELIEEYIYDDIPNLARILRSDIRELNSDNTFNLTAWTEKLEKINYQCN